MSELDLIETERLVLSGWRREQLDDLVRTDLVGPPVNITNTPYVSEHLGWSG